MTYRRYARVFAFLTLLLCASDNLQAQWGRQARSKTGPAVVRLTPRQQRNLIKYNEAGAIMMMRTLHSAEATYQATAGNGDYGTIEELRKENLIDQVLAEGHRFGYLFRVRREKHSAESQSSFQIFAVPRTYLQTGRRSFYMDDTGVIHAADKNGVEANLADDPFVIDP